MAEIHPASTLSFFPLSSRIDGDEAIIGRPDLGKFVEVPAFAVAIVESLACGRKIEDVQAAEFSKNVDIADFAGTLVRLEFVSHIDGTATQAAPLQKASLPWLRAGHVRWIFNSASLAFLCAVAVAGIVVGVWRGVLPPSYNYYFAFRDPGSDVLLGLLVPAIFITIHEFMHLAAARAYGVPGRVSFGTRLFFLVAQSDVSGIRVLSRGKRVKVYLAGIIGDLVATSLLCLSTMFWPNGLEPRLARCAILFLCSNVLIQLAFFMRTDIYFLVQDLTGASNLYQDARQLLKSRLARLARERSRTPAPEVKARVVRLYALFVMVGVTAVTVWFGAVVVPMLVRLFVLGVQTLVSGIHGDNTGDVLDGLATLVFEGSVQGAVLFLWIRRMLARRGVHSRRSVSA